MTGPKTRLRGIDEFREEDTLAARIDQRRAPKMRDASETERHTRAPGDEIYASANRWSTSKTVVLIVGLAVVAFFGMIFAG